MNSMELWGSGTQSSIKIHNFVSHNQWYKLYFPMVNIYNHIHKICQPLIYSGATIITNR